MKRSPLRIVPFLGGHPIKEVMPGLFAPAGTHMFYFGGPVISNVHIVQVLYGTGNYLSNVSSTVAPSVASFFTDVTQSFYFDLLSEYTTQEVIPSDGGASSNQIIAHGFFDGQFTITPSAANNSATITDSQIQSELLAQVNAGNLPAPVLDAQGNSNTIYMVYFPAGKAISLAPGVVSCTKGGFCAYHNSTTGKFGSHSLLYGVFPDMQSPSACSTGCGSNIPFDNVTIVSSHELAEAVTDADVGQANSIARPLAWFDPNTGAEIGDVCTGLPATFTANSITYSVQQEWSNLQDNCTGEPVTFTFSIPFPGPRSGVPIDVTVNAAASPTSAEALGNYRGTVHFTSTDPNAVLPADYTYTFADAGSHTFPMTLNGTGVQSITATDTQLPFSGTIAQNVGPFPPVTFTFTAPANVNLGSAFPVIVTAVDGNLKPVTSYNGTIHFSSNDPTALLPPDTALTNGSGTFSVTFNTQEPGTDNLEAADVGTPTTLATVVPFNILTAGPNSTTTTLTASPNPSTVGEPVVYTATVTGGTTPLSGSVSFGRFGTATLVNGQAQLTLTLSGGAHTVIADYFGTPQNSSSAPLTTIVNPASTSIALTSSQSPGNFGDNVTFTATVSSPASLIVSDGGLLTISDGGTPIAALQTGAVGSTGSGASFSTSSLGVGQHTLTASFSGNPSFSASTSAPLVQVVNPPSSPDIALTATPNSATLLAGQAATLSVSLQSLHGFTGIVKFSCGNLPRLTTCTFSPGIEFLVTAGFDATNLTIKTSGPHAALQAAPIPKRERRMDAFWFATPFGFGVILLPAVRRRKRLSSSAIGVALLMVLLAQIGCGGGGPKTVVPTPTPTPQITPAGTTNIQVIATATPASGPSVTTTKQLNVTLTVQP